MPEQVLEQFELSNGQIELAATAGGTPRHKVYFEVCGFQPEDLRRPAASQQSPDAGEQLGQRKRFDQVVVSAEIEAENPIFDAVARREDQHGRVNLPLP